MFWLIYIVFCIILALSPIPVAGYALLTGVVAEVIFSYKGDQDESK